MSKLLITVSLSLILVAQSQCRNACSMEEVHNASSTLALEITQKETYKASVKVYTTECPGLNTVGPSWYRLDVLGSAKHEGSFLKPSKLTAAALDDTGLVFTADAEPLAVYDLPREFSWVSNGDHLPANLCFRLVAKTGDECEEVLSWNCTDMLMEEIAEIEAAPTSSTTTTTLAEPKTTTPQPVPTTAAPALPTPDPALQASCHKQFNCTGKGGNGICGSDKRWYKNLCSLRYHRCIYDLKTLQRDREKISCIGVPKPDFSVTPPPPPPPSTLPTPSPHPCFEEHEQYKKQGIVPITRCRNDGKYRPVQCWPHPSIPGALQCGCYLINVGSLFKDSEWTVNCAAEPFSAPLPRCF